MYTELEIASELLWYLQFALISEVVLEDLALHGVLILVEEATMPIVSAARLVVVAEDVEVGGAIKVDRVCQHHRVVGALLHGVDVSVHIKLNVDLHDL